MKSIVRKLRNRLCVYSGEDYAIIRECDVKIQFKFSLIGLFVLAILICCFLSAMYFTEHLFHNELLDVGVGLVWGYIVTNLYVLLLYTITPVIIPTRKLIYSPKKQELDFNVSLILRLMLIVLLAIITAQPLNIYLLAPNSLAFAHDMKMLLSSNPLAWLLTLFVTSIFLIPIYLKYIIRKNSNFYEKKAYIEKRIVEEEYIKLRINYKQTLEHNISNYNRNTWNVLEPLLQQLKKHVDELLITESL
ncbi:MAG: DUF4407 domain-containing protein [Flavobacterium sp.]|nr:MAG: DUF4407 domain-containing protein [Flavobacterium sp.]